MSMETEAWPQTVELRCGPITALDLALFAAASGDHNMLHLDVATAQSAGFDRPVVHGMLTMAYAAQLCTARFGAGSVRSLRTRFTGVARLGDTVVLTATLTTMHDADSGSEALYDLAARTAIGSDLMVGMARVVRSGQTGLQ